MALSIYRYDAERLRQWMLIEMEKRNVAHYVAANVVSSVIETSLRGVDSHGINLFPHYCAVSQSGRINLTPNLIRSQTSASLAILDADWSFGHHAGALAMTYAQELASETGFALVNVTNSSHFGAAAYFSLRAARDDFMSFAFTNADSLVKAHNAKEAFFGTNPVCFAAPMDGEDPLCLDMATSTIPWNRIKNHRIENQSIEPGLAFDADGNTVADPHRAVSLAPTGSYKGFGLGLMVEVICSVLTGGIIGKDIAPMYANIANHRDIRHAFIALDLSKITDVGRFKAQITDMARRIRSLDPLGMDEVMVPGDPEKKAMSKRTVIGIPVNSIVHDAFMAIDSSIDSVVMSQENG